MDQQYPESPRLDQRSRDSGSLYSLPMVSNSAFLNPANGDMPWMKDGDKQFRRL
jgi:hypothetical protein